MASLLLVGLLLGLLAINVPVAVAFGLAAALFLALVTDVPLALIPQQMFGGTDSTVLQAVPFFLLAGAVMDKGGISRRLIDFANVLVGWLTGGLAMVSVLASMFFAGISGSAAADSAAVGSVMIPAMERKGYAKDFAAALIACAGTIGTMIPPSIPMIVYGVTTGTSIGALFIAGVVPGVLMGLALMAHAYAVSRRRGYFGLELPSARQAWVAFREALLTLLMPVIVVGGILGGVFTPTEAAAIAVFLSLVLGGLVYHELRWSDLPDILVKTGLSTGIVMFLIATSTAYGWILARQGIPLTLAKTFTGVTTSPLAFLLLANILLLVVGTVMETVPSIIIFAPVLLPLATQLGVDPVFFGVLMVVNLSMGLASPPSGATLFVSTAIAEAPLDRVCRAVWPLLVSMISILLLITFVPPLAMWLPRLVYGR
ncbi:MAG: C4-dicarboxylate ABC transporter permease [candidate division NC10 bacterium RBG_16_65_8]|nr:MAG: C4-dicarboxylate ABC transporter permease [candidate division NC10 bacterium RBG_16_65_8]